MPKVLSKIDVDGKKLNKCPICGGPCTISAWAKHKKCVECKRLMEKGLEVEEVRKIRTATISSEILEDEPEPKEDDLDELYDFRRSFPPGIRIFTRNREEAKHLKEVYNYYTNSWGNVLGYNDAVGSILQSKLELYRNSELLSSTTISPGEKKSIEDTNVKLFEHIKSSLGELRRAKTETQSEGTNSFIRNSALMFSYHHENSQEYHGMGVCPDCQQRIIFKTDFPTFKAYYIDHLNELKEKYLQKGIDNKVLCDIIRDIIKELDENSISDIYVAKHVRMLEASL